MFVRPNDPTKEKPISFRQAVRDKDGKIKYNYVLQQLLKNPIMYIIWKRGFAGVDERLLPYVERALRNFEKEKQHYLETGEIPVYMKLSFDEAFAKYESDENHLRTTGELPEDD